MTARRTTLILHGTADDGRRLQIKYYVDIRKSLENLFNLHLLQCPLIPNLRNARELVRVLREICNPHLTIYRAHRGRIQVSTTEPDPHTPPLPFPVSLLMRGNRPYLVAAADEVNRCEDCGSYYRYVHTCNVRRRDFYFHHVSGQSADWWEEVGFFPIGAAPHSRRLFVVYDVETYTWHGRHGKQLVPFMLVFTVFGDERLQSLAVELASELHWCAWPRQPHTFYYLNPQKGRVGSLFKQFRDKLQTATIALLWKDFYVHNREIVDAECSRAGLSNPQDLPFSVLQTLPLRGAPQFFEVYVVGHNISGFDEIVLAAQVINNKASVPPAFRVSRNFLPRCGKILFNDLTFGLPNPMSKKRLEYGDWEKGTPTVADYKIQYCKFMVRDTFALTHTSLRKAAAAYSLSVEKGCCPYQAVNEFYMLGTYRQDADSFPCREYWSSDEEYLLNKSLWLQEKQDKYDIVQHTLDYCALDVLVTAQLVLRLSQSYQQFVQHTVGLVGCEFNVFQRPTISSNSHAIFRQILFSNSRPQKASLGHILLAPSNEMYDYVRQSIRGGRCYPVYIGVLNQPLYVYDICGMYASALTHPMPSGKPLNPFERALAVESWQRHLDELKPINYFDPTLLPAIFTIDADPPEETSLDLLPPFCSRRGGRLCWTNESLRGEVATCLDVVTLHNRGWKVRLLPDPRTTVFPEWRCLARDYVTLNIAAKEQADREKNQTLRSISKLLSNALYGSFATKLDNKVTVFADQMEEKYVKGIAEGSYDVKSTAFVETDNLSGSVMEEFRVVYSPAPPTREHVAGDDYRRSHSSDEEAPEEPPLYTPEIPSDHVTYVYKPITFLEADDSAMCLQTLEKKSPLIFNNRYPSHIASFVLAWTRAFISEWATFLYAEDSGIPIQERPLKFVYGDTDSMFLTQAGKDLMDTRGRHRLKGKNRPLVFNPDHPELTWLVECETRCEQCGNEAYSESSVFLAPKLYALKNVYCPQCKIASSGKVRGKGHAVSQLSFDLLTACCYSDEQRGCEKFATSRVSLKKSLVNLQGNQQPFTVTETTLARTLRPWKDRTLRPLDQHRLAPYSNSHPNPREREQCWMEISWNMSPSYGTNVL